MTKVAVLLLAVVCLVGLTLAQKPLTTAEISRTMYKGGRTDSFKLTQDLTRAANGPTLSGEASRTKFPGGRTDSFKISQDALRSKDGKWSAGGYIQHDRTKLNGQRFKNTHGGVQVTRSFNGPKLTAEASRTGFPGGRTDSFKLSQDAWRSKDGKWSAGGYVQHDRTKYNGQRFKDTQGGFRLTGRF